MPPKVTLHLPKPLPEAGAPPPAAAFARVLARAGARGGEVDLILADDLELRRLNAAYRGKDRPTDVLAFDYLAPEAPGGAGAPAEAALGAAPPPREAGAATSARRRRGAAPRPPDGCLWGDVFVSADAALRQARERGLEPGEELARLFLHGCLHLLGYRDETPAERARMLAVQEALLPELLRGPRRRR